MVELSPVRRSRKFSLESLEARVLFSYSPGDIRQAYGINGISFNGTAGTGAGQTIAIVDAYNDPNIIADATTFSINYDLQPFDSPGGPKLSVVNEYGLSGPLPANASTSTGPWDSEEAMDVEWAHVIAPKASIVLVEASSTGDWDLYQATVAAASLPGVSVVEMSWGSSEFLRNPAYNSKFTTPLAHQGVTFLAAAGDNGAPGNYPAFSPNVIAVGGTTLALDADGNYASESAYANGGGGVSLYQTQPSYQVGNVNGLGGTPARRAMPDVSAFADPGTGVNVYNSWNGGANNGGYSIGNGTSLSCVLWAGLIAVANQGRVSVGMGTLDGATQTLPRLYSLPSSDFHDVTTGNNGYAAGPGYDLATGLGTPVANKLVPDLAGVTPIVTKVQINGDDPNGLFSAPGQTAPGVQRSMVEDIVYSFNTPVSIADANAAFTVVGTGIHAGVAPSSLTAVAVPGSGDTQWAVTLTGKAPGVLSSIENGTYSITANPAGIVAEFDGKTTLNSARTDSFFRLFGDITGDGLVSNGDTNRFKSFFSPIIRIYNPIFDGNGDGFLTNIDLSKFKNNLSVGSI